MISRASKSSILQGFAKSRSLLAGNTAYEPSQYESIQTVTVGASPVSTITFSSIPSTYTHLQIRGIAVANDSSTPSSADYVKVTFNSDTGANYSWHPIHGNGSSASSAGYANYSSMFLGWVNGYGSMANNVSPTIIDILDYKDTNKYKTCRSLSGYDFNGSGADQFISWWSGNWRSTAAISTITLEIRMGFQYKQYTKFALYGIKVA